MPHKQKAVPLLTKGTALLPDKESNLEPPDPETGALPIELSGTVTRWRVRTTKLRRIGPGVQERSSVSQPLAALFDGFSTSTGEAIELATLS